MFIKFDNQTISVAAIEQIVEDPDGSVEVTLAHGDIVVPPAYSAQFMRAIGQFNLTKLMPDEPAEKISTTS